jgi:uncharacterized protein
VLDTSLIVSALTNETGSSAAIGWLAQHARDELAISEWTPTEFASALSMKLRGGQISHSAYHAAHTEFEALAARQFVIVPVTSDHFEHATAFCRNVATAMRAPDALQLATSFLAGGTLVTLDRKLHQGAMTMGLWAVLPQ